MASPPLEESVVLDDVCVLVLVLVAALEVCEARSSFSFCSAVVTAC
jgi:hypothetical protein